MGLGSFIKGNLPVIGAVAGGVGGLLGSLGADKRAKQEAANLNAQNKWKNKLDTGMYETEQMPYLRQGAKTRSLRNQLAAGLANASTSGLAKMFPGYFKQEQQFNGTGAYDVTNPYVSAGPVPEIKAATGGWKGALGGLIGGAAGGLGGGR